MIDYERMLVNRIHRLELIEKEFNMLKGIIHYSSEQDIHGDILIKITRQDQMESNSWADILKMSELKEQQ